MAQPTNSDYILNRFFSKEAFLLKNLFPLRPFLPRKVVASVTGNFASVCVCVCALAVLMCLGFGINFLDQTASFPNLCAAPDSEAINAVLQRACFEYFSILRVLRTMS